MSVLPSVTLCPRRGHDLREAGAIEEYLPGKWRCAVCRRIDDRDRRRNKRLGATECPNGHPYTDDSVRTYTAADGHVIRVCKICHKAGTMAATRRKQKQRGAGPRTDTTRAAERVLQLWDEHWRAATHMERTAILAQIAALQPKHSCAGLGRTVQREPRALSPST
jgi:hypothetical protein